MSMIQEVNTITIWRLHLRLMLKALMWNTILNVQVPTIAAGGNQVIIMRYLFQRLIRLDTGLKLAVLFAKAADRFSGIIRVIIASNGRLNEFY